MDGASPIETPATDLDAIKATRWAARVRRWKIFLVFLVVGGGTFAGYFRRPLFWGNVDAVDEGVVYRGAQPVGDVIGLIRDRKIASVLNLRGGDAADPWYVAEVEATRAAGVDFYDMPMSAVKRPARRELLALLDVLDRCRYPLFIHCKSGSDRTGLASALYLMERKGVAPGPASAAFSLAHGHVPLLGPERLHEPFAEYSAWLAEGHLDHTPARFRDWVAHHYRADDPLTPLDPVRPGPRTRTRHQADRPSETALR